MKIKAHRLFELILAVKKEAESIQHQSNSNENAKRAEDLREVAFLLTQLEFDTAKQ